MGHSSATFLLLAGLSQVQEVPGFTLSWINKVISPDGCSASFVLEKVRCCKCAASSGLCGSSFFPGLWPGTLLAPVMAMCCTTNGQVQCDCISGGGTYGPYPTYLSLQHWDMHILQIGYRNLDKPGWCSFTACAESHILLDRAIVPRDRSFCVPRSWMSAQVF